jgi:hypothetical protein
MTSSKKDSPNGKPVRKNIQEKVNLYEDEIDLIDYLGILWKRKYFVVLGTVLPALLVFLILTLLPRDYKITYTYDIGPHKRGYNMLVDEFYSAANLDIPTASVKVDELVERGRKILLDRIYSAENLDNLVTKLRENGFDEYSKKMARENIELGISYTLLTVTIIGSPEEDMQRISSILRDNFERVVPIYCVKQELSGAIAKFKSKIANIEENKFSLELDLERKKAFLTRLKDLEPADSNEIPGNIILQFDNISKNSEYLPLAYQVQITDANIIKIEETIKANQEKYNYYKRLISLNERLFDEVKNKTSSYYNIQQFHSFLTGIVNDHEDKELADYLNAYIKRIENTASTNIPVVEKPNVHLVPKNIVKKITVLFAALLLIMTLAAFLLEAVKEKRAPAS